MDSEVLQIIRTGGGHIPVYIALILIALLNVNSTQVDVSNAVSIEPAWETWELTAYTDAPEENGGWTITASGAPFTDDQTLACPKSIPFGTEIEIDGVGVRTCHDRGGAIKGKRIDVFIRDTDEAQRFGRQKRKIRILGE